MFQCIYYEIYGIYSMECMTKIDFCNVWLKKTNAAAPWEYAYTGKVNQHVYKVKTPICKCLSVSTTKYIIDNMLLWFTTPTAIKQQVKFI